MPITEKEKQSATVVSLDSVLSDIDDTADAFNEFRSGFDEGEEPGTIRAYELTIDERGNIGTRRTQTRLGAWPIDAHKFDELCQMLIDQFMLPTQTYMAVRLVAVDPKKSGYALNRIVMLKKALKKESSSTPVDSTASIMKAMQEMNERNMEMFRRMQPAPAEKTDTMAEINKMMAFAQAMNAPMMGMLSTLLPALAGRPAPAAADPFGSITGLLDVAERISDMRGGGSGGDDNSFAGIVRAVTPLVTPALQALPAIAAMMPKPAPVLLPAAPRPAAPSPSVPTQAATQAANPTPAPTPAQPMQPTDIPSGDSAMLAQLKPQIDSLVAMAEQKSDPTGSADLVFDQIFSDPRLSDDDFEKLAGFVDNEQFITYVQLINPAAKLHVEWFEIFKTQIVKRLDEQDAAPEVPGMHAPTVVKTN
jgi:hypothetical protein